MKFLVDENIPLITVEMLRSAGHDIRDVRGSELQGIDDEMLWKLAQSEKRLLLTTDKGFALFRNETHCGILIVLLARPSRKAIHDRIMLMLKQQLESSWPGLIIVVRDRVKSAFRANSGKSR